MLVQRGMVLRNAGERAPDRMRDTHPRAFRGTAPIEQIATLRAARPVERRGSELGRGDSLTGLSDQMGDLAESRAVVQPADVAGERDRPILPFASKDGLIDRRGVILMRLRRLGSGWCGRGHVCGGSERPGS